jgi:hypothetical protein
MTSTIEETEIEQQTKARPKANAGARRAHRAAGKGRSGKKAGPKKKAPQRATKAHSREGSKTASILDLLKRPDGATTKELLKATDWQPHSLRGFLSGTVKRKMGMTVFSTKNEDGERVYSIKP